MADDVPIVAEDDEQLQKRRPQAIPVNRERDAPPLSVANANPNAAVPLTTAAPQTAKPIPVLPSGKPYPVGRVAGIPGYENPPTAESPLGSVTPPHPVGVAQLASKAENIHNPFLRSLAKVGAYGARALDTAGTILAPRITEAIPGTTMNQAVKVGAQQRQEAEQTKEGLEKAETHNQEAEATERENAGPKLGTPEEQTFAYLLTQTDPETKKPYTPMAAFSAAQQAKQDVKPKAGADKTIQTEQGIMQYNPQTQRYDIPAGEAPGSKTPPHVSYDAGIPVSVTAGKKTYDINDPNLPPELKPLVESANRAHTQHTKEEADKTAAANSEAEKRFQEHQDAATAATKSMREAAPGVIALAERIGKLVDEQEKNLGPEASRWNEFMAGKVGAPNPEFTKLRTDVGLLTTKLMRMHVGARGGELMMQHFKDLIDTGKQSPENLRAALGEIVQYAKETAAEGQKPAEGKTGNAADPLGIR